MDPTEASSGLLNMAINLKSKITKPGGAVTQCVPPSPPPFCPMHAGIGPSSPRNLTRNKQDR